MAADIQVILEVLGAEDMEKAARATVTLTNKVDRLGKQLKKGTIDNTQFQRGVQQLIKKNAELGGGYKNLQKEVQRYAFSMQRRVNEEIRAEAAVENVIRTTNNYTQATNRATVATTSAAEAAARHAAAQRMAGKSTNRFGMYAQQVGYQVGDFFVQVQSGTNALVAFGQQGTQLAGLLPGLTGAIVGISLSVGTMLGGAFMRTRQEADTLKTSLEELSSTISMLNGVIDTQEMSIVELTDKYGKLAVGIRQTQIAMAEAAAQKAFLAIKEDTDLLSDSVSRLKVATKNLEIAQSGAFEKLPNILRTAQDPLKRAEIIVRDIAKELGVSEQQAIAFGKAMNDFNNAETLEQQALAAADVVKFLDQIPDSIKEQNRELLDAIIKYSEMSQGAAEAARATQKIEENAPGSGWMDSAIAGVRRLISALNIAASKATIKPRIYTPEQQRIDELAAQYSLYGQGQTATRQRVGEQVTSPTGRLPSIRIPSVGGGGGSSGGGASGPNPIEQAQEYLEKIQREAEFKRTLVGLTDEQATQEKRRNQILTQLNGYEEGLGEQYSERINQIIQMEAETRKLIEAEQQREQMMNTITSNIESAFMSVVDGSKSVEDAFKGMLRNIILAIYQQQVAQPAATALGGLFNTAIGSLFGPGMTTGTPLSIPSSGVGSLLPDFDGGGFTGYGPRSGGMDGKGGMLAMVHPNETVIDHTKGQTGGGTTVVNNNFNISANGDDSVKRIIRGEIPRITEATKAAVVDAKRRGGSYGRSF